MGVRFADDRQFVFHHYYFAQALIEEMQARLEEAMEAAALAAPGADADASR